MAKGSKKKKKAKEDNRLREENFFWILLFSFVFIVSFTAAVNAFKKDTYVAGSRIVLAGFREENEEKEFIPVLTDNPVFPVFSGQSVLAIDMDSGTVLFEKNPDVPLLPASTTKVMTALVTLDYFNLDNVVTVDQINVPGQKMKLVAGEQITIRDLLYGLLVYSANDAAEVLAQNFPGGRDVFVTAMNLKAKELHLDHTNFTNPSGLDGQNHLSTARDLYKLAKVAMKNSVISQTVATKEKTVYSTDGKISHKLVNINELLGQVDGVLGVKTGWTENAKENLITYIKRGDRDIMIVVLGSKDRFGETKEIINWIFRSYTWKTIN
jgi:D-alanyl-D-alanine carboxypeptidase (penicillin-binding protein 5/6)